MPLTRQQLLQNAWLASPAAFAARLSEGRWRRPPHLHYLSQWLAETLHRRRKRIIVSMPPRHGKSELTSHWFPGWYLNLAPSHRVILASYEADFAANWGRRVRNTLTQHRDQLQVRIAEDSSAANRWDTTQGGGMMTAGVGGPITGKGAHLLLVDDPIKNMADAMSPTLRQKVWDWWTSTAYTRLEPDGVAVVIMTRWNEDDLVGRLLKDAREGGEPWDVLELPAIAEQPGDALERQVGDALWPDRFSVERLTEIKRSVGSVVWTSLYQQRPAPMEGGMFKRGAWRFWKVMPAKFDQVVQSWDFSVKDTEGTDYAVGQVWGRIGAEKYLLDQVRARMDIVASLAAVRTLSAKWPQATAKLVEEKANGTNVIRLLRQEVPGLIAIDPGSDSKTLRALSVMPEVEAGNIYLPDPGLPSARWVHDFIEECAAFDNGAHDDQVDAMTQVLIWFARAPQLKFTQTPGQYGQRRM